MVNTRESLNIVHITCTFTFTINSSPKNIRNISNCQQLVQKFMTLTELGNHKALYQQLELTCNFFKRNH